MVARLGDDVDDFCIKCKRITNHVVVSLLDEGPAKVRCRTCHSDHDYRHEQAPPPKIDPRKAALLLEKVAAAERANGASAGIQNTTNPVESGPDVPGEQANSQADAIAAGAGKSTGKTLKARKAQS